MPNKTSKEIEDKAVALHKSLIMPCQICDQLPISKVTFYRILKSRGISPIWEASARSELTRFRCTKCGKIKPIEGFPNAYSKNIFARKKPHCKICGNLYRALWRSRNSERDKKYNRDRVNRLRKTNPQFKRAQNLRRIVCAVLKRAIFKSGYKKRKPCSRITDLIGCSVPYLASHLESLFKPGMSWGNHSRSGWHIDHKVPYQQFDLMTPEGCRAWYHWTNLQPLWANENKLKSNKLNFVS